MKIAIVVIAALVALPGFADEASKRAKAQELMTLLNVRQMQDQIFTSVKRMTAQQVERPGQTPEQAKAAKEITDKIMNLVQARMNWDVMEPDFVKIYMESFTEEELDGIVGFYKSPAGKAMTAKMPVLMQKSMAVAQQRMADIGPEIDRLVKEGAAAK